MFIKIICLYIYIDISDTGKGINPRDKKNIFKPGFSSKKRGWGLGLSLAKRIIELTDIMYKKFGFDFHVELSTKPEKAMGSKVSFRLVGK